MCDKSPKVAQKSEIDLVTFFFVHEETLDRHIETYGPLGML